MAWAMVTGGSWEWLCAIRDSNPEPADYVPAFLLPVMRAA
jgi:hypothetical protein